MNNKIKILQRKIKLYYKKNSRLLPWRIKLGKNQDPYKTLISEIMLQQTRVKAVLDYYKVFLIKFPETIFINPARQIISILYFFINFRDFFSKIDLFLNLIA